MLVNLSRLCALNKHVKISSNLRIACMSFSDDTSNKDDKIPDQIKKDKRKPEASESSTDRLNKLLASMPTKDASKLVAKKITQQPKVNLKKNKRKEESSDSDSDAETKPQNILQAVKKVASLVDEKNPKQVESELLSKLLAHTDNLEDFNAKGKNEKMASDSLKDLIVGMKVDRVSKQKIGEEAQSRAQMVRKNINNRGFKPRDDNQGPYQRRDDNTEYRKKRVPQPTGPISSVTLFGTESLDIFTDVASLKESPDILKTWKTLHDRELKLAVTHPPANYLQKIALWTEQGKFWKFPIDNEQGMEEEAKVYFADHVFLEQHLEGWCPSRGPIRHFMELVCVGLSKNPYISAQAKKDHILWFQEYFDKKKDLLSELIQQDSSETVMKLDK